MKRAILIVDDDPAVRSVLRRSLAARGCAVLEAENGPSGLSQARDLGPDLILLDVHLPGLDGWSVAKALREDQRTHLTPLIMLTGAGEVADRVEGLSRGADDYVTKPFALDELLARVERLLRRHAEDLSASPLTLLPGGATLKFETARRLSRGGPLALLYADIDRFKAYNDAYGYFRGDAVLRETAAVLEQALGAAGGPGDFLGHIGGDDFVLLTEPARAEALAREAAARFDAALPSFYQAEDLARGFVAVVSRQGREEAAELVSLSIAIVSNERRSFDHAAEISDAAASVKKALKRRAGPRASAWLKDRRSDAVGQARLSRARQQEAGGLPAAA